MFYICFYVQKAYLICLNVYSFVQNSLKSIDNAFFYILLRHKYFCQTINHMKIILRLFFCLFGLYSCSQTETNDKPKDNEQNTIITNDISNQQITAWGEDEKGHIWIGTFRGLNKFSIHEYHQYFCTDDSLDIPDNHIQDIFRDSQNRLWISTVNGVALYTNKDNFKTIPIHSLDKNGLQISESHDGKIILTTSNAIHQYNDSQSVFNPVISHSDSLPVYNLKSFIDTDNNLWVITTRNLNCYSLPSYKKNFSIPLTEYCKCAYLSPKGELWMAGDHSVTVFDTHHRQYNSLPHAIATHPILQKVSVEYIYPYQNGILFSTQGRGLFYYNQDTGSVLHQGSDGFPFEVPSFKISRMFTDSQGNLWIGSVDQGYAVHYRYKTLFNGNNYLTSFFKDRSVISLAADKQRNLWIATLTNDLYVYISNKKKIVSIPHNSLFTDHQDDAAYINQVYVGTNNIIWMTATSNEVLECRFDKEHFRIVRRYKVPMPMSITQDENQSIWVGSASTFLHVLRKGDKGFHSIPIFKGYTFIPGLLPLGNGQLLTAAFYQPLKVVSSNGNIFDFDITKKDFECCIRRSVFIPTVLYKDSHGKIWIGTVSNGLLCYSPETKKIQRMDHVTCTDISGIEEDLQGNLWISTLYGLNKYIPYSNQLINYYKADGIGGNQFYDRSSCKLADGTLVFGGTHGLTIFNPANIQLKHNIPLLFEDLKIHNQLIRPGEGNCIDKHLSYNPDINLNHKQNGFSISFSALDYSEAERIHYYYKLEGFDGYWIDAHNNREAYYANLPAGSYTFKVKIIHNDQNSTEKENSIRITVHPAPWTTKWAYLVYMTIGLGILGYLQKNRKRIKAEKNAVRQAEQAKERELFINKMNMNFFANVSHEFRTPLTMINGPVSLLYNAPDLTEKNKELIRIIQRSVNRMLRLVNQMLEFNKLENDALKLKVYPTDIIAFLKEETDVFHINAEEKSLRLITNGLEGSFIAWIDEDKIDKIFVNLMSNALKFTSPKGCIFVNFDVISNDSSSQSVKIEVINTGKLIPSDKLEKIFERYYQLSDDYNGTHHSGTGIGLYYARSLARIHHGSLEVANLEKEGKVVFTLTIPANQSSYSERERTHVQANQMDAFPLDTKLIVPQKYTDTNHKKKNIMVVDDDSEVAYYLEVLLGTDYHITCKFNAETALESMNEKMPDLLLSDVVMPGKDGYWLCREVKENLKLCHIPVILVTAKTDIENQVEGLNVGADGYVTKPFDPHYLQALIKSLLANREKARNILSQSTQTNDIDNNILSPQDNAFMTELYRLMESELSNPELDITRMTQILKISRTKLYYKIKGLTGENPSVFFKTYKLNRASELLKEGKYTISEIADMTGFNTLSHFSKSFKLQFGSPPSEYLGKKQEHIQSSFSEKN